MPIDKCERLGCVGLRDRYKKDPTLLHFYARNLLLRGWAGSTDVLEKGYQAAHASWYKVAQESGQRMAQEMARREREVQDGEASTPSSEGNFATAGGEAGLTAMPTDPETRQLRLALT